MWYKLLNRYQPNQSSSGAAAWTTVDWQAHCLQTGWLSCKKVQVSKFDMYLIGHDVITLMLQRLLYIWLQARKALEPKWPHVLHHKISDGMSSQLAGQHLHLPEYPACHLCNHVNLQICLLPILPIRYTTTILNAAACCCLQIMAH